MEGAAYQASGFSLFCFVSCLRSAPRRMTPQVMEAGGDRRPSRRCSQLVSVGSIGQGLSPRLGVPASLGHVLVVGVGDRHDTRITSHGPRQCLRVVVPALWPLLDGDAPFALCSDRGGTPPRSCLCSTPSLRCDIPFHFCSLDCLHGSLFLAPASFGVFGCRPKPVMLNS